MKIVNELLKQKILDVDLGTAETNLRNAKKIEDFLEEFEKYTKNKSTIKKDIVFQAIDIYLNTLKEKKLYIEPMAGNPYKNQQIIQSRENILRDFLHLE